MKIIEAFKGMIDDLSSIEVATVTNDGEPGRLVAYSKIQLEGDHLSVVLSDDPEHLEIQKKSIESAQELRKQTLELISGIISNQ